MDLGTPASSSIDVSALKSCPQSHQGIRVVGKVRPFSDSEDVGNSNISITRFDGTHALIGFGDQNSSSRKYCYKLDWCYEQDEGNTEVFNGEIKPLLEDLYCGRNACVIAYGARRSGKSQLIQGCEQNPGLVLIAISEILSYAQKIRGSVAVSCYEVSEDHLYDILESKRHELPAPGDAKKKIQLKDLSKVLINSLSDFKQLYYQVPCNKKTSRKLTDDAPIRCHKGLIVYVLFGDKESKDSIVGKLNIIDLAGYEDSSSKGNAKTQTPESDKVNKSLYTLLKVIFALNAAKSYVPYRESELTRLLQDFVCKTSRTVLFTCLIPRFCQDNIHIIKSASYLCKTTNQFIQDSSKIMKSSSRVFLSCSPSIERKHILDSATKKDKIPIFETTGKRGQGTLSMNQLRYKPLVCSEEKQLCSKSALVEKQENDSSFTIKGRKLFSTGVSPLAKNLKVEVERHASEPDLPIPEEGKVELHAIKPSHSISEEASVDGVGAANIGDIVNNMDDCVTSEVKDADFGEGITEKSSTVYHDSTGESKDTSIEGKLSPRISDQLKEISNSLKLFSVQSTNVEIPRTDELCAKEICNEANGPKTPRVPFGMELDRGQNTVCVGTPQDILKNRSTGLKKHLVQDCLTFLNSANKEELMGLKGIGKKRADYIMQLREESPEPFKDIDDLKDIGLSTKQINAMMSRVLGEF